MRWDDGALDGRGRSRKGVEREANGLTAASDAAVFRQLEWVTEEFQADCCMQKNAML